ncbi:MDR family MFS transporter [Risungbinella massiliensis]|uniref:MDR family MFS transporter n=1 Tax=Risungbinella massiliensis TaxID=1329796 RepID=UPI0005CC28F7|nr:MFS transporter [Risungbinella massiliensis]
MKHLRNIHPISWTIIIGTIFGRMATSMSIPFLAIYLIKVHHATPFETGLVIAISSLIGIIVSFYGGYLSDRIGRKKMILLSIFGWSFVFLGFTFSQTILSFFLVNALNGLCRSLFEPASRALLSDITQNEQKLLVFNLRYTAINLGVVFGPFIGLMLGSSQTTFPFMIAFIIYFLYGMVFIYQFHTYPKAFTQNNSAESISMRNAFQMTKKDKVFLFIIIGTIFCVFGYGQFTSTLPQYFSLLPDFENGTKFFSYMLSLNAVAVLILQYPIVHIAKKYSPINSLILGNLFISVSLVSFSITKNSLALIVIVIAFTIGEILTFTMIDLFVDTIAKSELKGTYFGTLGFTQLGNVLAPIIGGFLLDHFGIKHPITIFSSLLVLTLLGIPFLVMAKWRLTFQKNNHTGSNVRVSH